MPPWGIKEDKNQVKIIAFLGSPRKDGNTELLLREAIKAIRESGFRVKTFNLNRMKIRPCEGCGMCSKTGTCKIGDDMRKIYTAIRESHRFILASPIFFFGMSAQTKTMIDRCQAFWCERYLLKMPIIDNQYGRRGLLILVGGTEREIGFQCAEATAKAFFRTISVPEHNTLSIMDVDAKGEILRHPTALKDAYRAGKDLIGIDG